MRIITKDIQLTIDGSPQRFRLTKPDAFSGVEILRLLLRLQDQWDGGTRGRFSQLHERETREPSPAFPVDGFPEPDRPGNAHDLRRRRRFHRRLHRREPAKSP